MMRQKGVCRREAFESLVTCYPCVHWAVNMCDSHTIRYNPCYFRPVCSKFSVLTMFTCGRSIIIKLRTMTRQVLFFSFLHS